MINKNSFFQLIFLKIVSCCKTERYEIKKPPGIKWLYFVVKNAVLFCDDQFINKKCVGIIIQYFQHVSPW